VFPSAVQERGLGTVIGVPTLGFVIAVSPHHLVDGGSIRKTFIGIWEESTGAQLEKAIEFLMEKIGDTPRDFEAKVKIDER